MLSKIIIILTSLVFAIPVVAQDSKSQIWNWAWNRSSGTLFAYSENGDVNTLFTEIDDWVDTIWRIDQNRAVGVLQTKDDANLYLIDDTSAQPFISNIDTQEFKTFIVKGNGFRLAEYRYPYLLLTTSTPLSSISSRPALLLNIDTKQTLLINQYAEDYFRFVDGATQLRFATLMGEDGKQTLEVHELSLIDKTDQVLYSLSGTSLSIEADNKGERWLVRDWNTLDNVMEYRLFSVGDNSEVVLYKSDLTEPVTLYSFENDVLVSKELLKPTCCTTLGIKTPKGIGYIYFSPHLPSSISPGGRYALIADAESDPRGQRYVMNLETDDILFYVDQALEDPLYMTYVYNGFIINTQEKGQPVMYHYSTNTITTLPSIGNGDYFDILPNGDVLYSKVTGESKTQLVRYNPKTNESLLLLKDVLPIHARDVRVPYSY